MNNGNSDAIREEDVYDITIIGGGPVGLYGLYYAGMREMRAKVVESLSQIGGQLMALYPEKYIYDVPGFRKVLAKDLIANLEEQAFQYAPSVCLNEKVLELERGGDGVITLTTDKSAHFTRTVLVAAGLGAFIPKKLDIPHLDELEGRGVHYFVRDREIFRDRALLIVGGGDSAVDWALNLESVARRITLIHRRDRFRAHETSVDQLMRSTVEVRTFHELKTIRGDDRVQGVTIFDNRTGEEYEYDVDDILMNIGFLANLGPIKNWGVKIWKNSVTVGPTMETSIPGVYAAGDIVMHPGHLKLISVGAAEAAVAVNWAKHAITPEASVEPGHSSNRTD